MIKEDTYPYLLHHSVIGEICDSDHLSSVTNILIISEKDVVVSMFPSVVSPRRLLVCSTKMQHHKLAFWSMVENYFDSNVAVTLRHSCSAVVAWGRVVLHFIDPKQLLRVSCFLWCYLSKWFLTVLVCRAKVWKPFLMLKQTLANSIHLSVIQCVLTRTGIEYRLYRPYRLFKMCSDFMVVVVGLSPLVGPGTIGGMPSVRVFVKDPSPYLREFRRKPRKTPKG